MLTWTILARLAIVATLPLLLMARLPSGETILLLVLVGLALLHCAYPPLRLTGITLLFLAWACNDARLMVRDIEKFSARPATYTLQISELRKERKQIRVRLLEEQGRMIFPPRFAWLFFDTDPEIYCPGQRWTMHLRLRPVHARLNEGDFDAQRFALANNTPLQGRILKQDAISDRCDGRWRFIVGHRDRTREMPSRGTLEALAFGIREEMSPQTRQLLRDTGTAHLMAISGMHIALAASTGWVLARGVQFILPARFIGYLFPLIVSWLFAAIYTWLSGAQPPAARSLLALTLWTITRLAGVQLNSWQIWTFCIALLLVMDPLTVLSDSFWLSVLAVGMLLVWYHWFPLPAQFRHQWRWIPVQLLHLQAGMMILMVPLQVAIFNGISLTALVANVVAIPVVSFITMPLVTLALLLPVAHLSGFFWGAADLSLRALFHCLTLLPPGWWPLSGTTWFTVMVWGGLILWRAQLFFSLPLSSCALALAMILSRQPNQEQGWRIDMLDIGHGLSLVISQGDEAVMYDTGPRWQNDNAGSRVIIPWLERRQLRLKQVILSHKHLDHTGGLEAITQRWPAVDVRSALADEAHLPCVRGTQWRWRQLHFRVVWPLTAPLPGGNNDSCVVIVDDGQVRLMLTGDIEAKAERQLVALEKQGLKVDILQVPHHGSRTSSTSLLLRKAAGHTAIASLARYNAWRMPAKNVLENYRTAGFQWLDTGQSGQISIRIAQGRAQVSTLRDQLMPRWYHQWFGVKRESR
ncbi:DNA internalization-related competence protein ComEC/Rec2 [Pantoea sp. XY16]|uniref:DNA internalization-related competence protein ComEC/Rec2 n=1 Tax=Pantoea sp. XY16 TaxID=2976705 RepID=UPI0021A4A9F4|nr:DNA internalization-related competence protein ComEC/Rec2 [Pantoea sp. XY16]MCT2416719.1 DNA internalization-related competence protein ComEC/Rec2 [Pantoea sp. XY16]